MSTEPTREEWRDWARAMEEPLPRCWVYSPPYSLWETFFGDVGARAMTYTNDSGITSWTMWS